MKLNTNQKSISEKMKDYYNKRSSSEEAHELENLALEDDFASDAMEGLDAFPEALSSIPEFPSAKNYNGIYIASFAVVLAFVSWFLFFNSDVTPTSNLVQVTEKENNKIDDLLKENGINKNDIREEIDQQKKIKSKVKTQKEEISYPKREKFEFKKMELTPLEIEEKKLHDLARTKTKIIGFHNYFVVDYSVIYTNAQNFETEIGGISANRENETSKSKFGEKNTQKKVFTYKEYLKESLGYLENKNYTLALQNFEIILKYYPRDVNAQFYIGYIYFYQNKNEESIKQMDMVLVNSFDFFSEDANWYKANALENLGKLKKAKEIYSEIKRKGGYYSFQIK